MWAAAGLNAVGVDRAAGHAGHGRAVLRGDFGCGARAEGCCHEAFPPSLQASPGKVEGLSALARADQKVLGGAGARNPSTRGR